MNLTKRWRGVNWNIRQGLYDEIQKARGQANELALGAGEHDEQEFVDSILSLGLLVMKKMIHDKAPKNLIVDPGTQVLKAILDENSVTGVRNT